eukprot:763030-Hanusia_phi.AAC.1
MSFKFVTLTGPVPVVIPGSSILRGPYPVRPGEPEDIVPGHRMPISESEPSACRAVRYPECGPRPGVGTWCGPPGPRRPSHCKAASILHC